MKKTISVIGSGPSALMLAAVLDEKKFDVTLYEKKKAPARKFLVAGDGGFNLTHGEDTGMLITRYTPAGFLEHCLRSFTNNDFREWLKRIGIETYVGTSNRVFPVKGTKPVEVLNAILKVLEEKNVKLKLQHEWIGWDEENRLLFSDQHTQLKVKTDIAVFALGGCSWSKTGSDGVWKERFEEKNISVVPFRASNCAYELEWKSSALSGVEGRPLKNISISCGGKKKSGEIVITKAGIEGGAVYALSPEIRSGLEENNVAFITIDLKPVFSIEEIRSRLAGKGNYSVTDLLRQKLNFNEVHIALLKATLSKEEFTNMEILSERIKELPLEIKGSANIDEAISTVGGIALDEVDKNFEFKKMPGSFALGEMLDWDAPTGGYLLQACFSMGHYLANYLDHVYE